MVRSDIYTAVDAERKSQDEKWPNREQYKYAAPHILVLETKISRLRAIWYESKKEDIKAELVKIAAIAVRALEEVQ
jgi:hypothetical protein